MIFTLITTKFQIPSSKAVLPTQRLTLCGLTLQQPLSLRIFQLPSAPPTLPLYTEMF